MQIERRYSVDFEIDETGMVIATTPAIPGVVEQGETEEEARERLEASVNFLLTTMIEDGEEIPVSDVSTHSVGVHIPA